MVGVGEQGFRSMLARVCILNFHGSTVYSKYVAPTEPVVDYRTKFSGIRRKDLVDAPPFSQVQQEVAEIIKGRILIGHGLGSDLKALKLSHPREDVRDTAKFRPLKQVHQGVEKPRKLEWLAEKILNVQIQTGEHNPEEDARASLLIYKALRHDWEGRIARSKKAKAKKKQAKKTTSK